MKSIIFNQHQVNHALRNKEGMFRIVMKGNPFIRTSIRNGSSWYDLSEAPHQVGETIFVKEKFAEVEVGAGFGYNIKKQILYRADDDYVVDWSPAQHMKQEHSRLTLRIKSVKVQRLQDISEEDALREGVKYEGGCEVPSISFKMDWNSTHKKPEEKWEANPWIFAYEYEVVR